MFVCLYVCVVRVCVCVCLCVCLCVCVFVCVCGCLFLHTFREILNTHIQPRGSGKSVHLSQKWDYDQLHSNHGKVLVFRLLVCDVCVGSKALSIPGGLRLYLFKQLLGER